MHRQHTWSNSNREHCQCKMLLYCHNTALGFSAFPCWPGTVMSGSHSDTVKMGGPYDGALGAIGAIAALRFLRDAGFKPAKSMMAIMFTTEEASRYSVPCLGR